MDTQLLMTALGALDKYMKDPNSECVKEIDVNLKLGTTTFMAGHLRNYINKKKTK